MLCRDVTFLELATFGMLLAFIATVRPSFDKFKQEFEFSNSGAQKYWNFMEKMQVFFSFFVAFITIVISMRFYFSLKATRIFGPFTKLIKLNAIALAQWLTFMLLLLLVATNYFSVLLHQNQACSGLYSCLKGLIESTVGRTDFSKADNNWSANLSIMISAYILAAILTNMVIAKMNSTYQEVRRKGTLHYYKDLFDLR